MPNWVLRVLLGGLFGVLLGLGIRITQLSLSAADYFRAYYSKLGVSENLDTQFSYLIEGFTLGVLPAGSAKESVTLAVLDGAQVLQAAAESYSENFLWVAAAFIVVGLLGSLWPSDSRGFARCLIMVALVCMVVGQVAPIMSMTAMKEVMVAGNSVVKQECKSIQTAVFALYGDGKVWVAGLIVIFSLVTPALKLGLMMIASRVSSGRVRDAAMWFVKGIGKWSMADVFVVALLLTTFSLKSSPGDSLETRSEVEIGLWFFASHCVLSMIATILVVRMPKSRPLLELAPTGAGPLLFQMLVCGVAVVASLVVLRPAVRATDKVVVEVGYRWACSVIAQDTPGWLRGRWRSHGQQHGGADDTMVRVTVLGPEARALRVYDHESAGTFDIPIAAPGIYSIVFDNVGLIRATSRSVEAEMWFEPNNPLSWPF